MNGRIHQLAKQLTLAEKCALLSGQDMWHTHDVARLNIPAITLSDGPSGCASRRARAITWA